MKNTFLIILFLLILTACTSGQPDAARTEEQPAPPKQANVQPSDTPQTEAQPTEETPADDSASTPFELTSPAFAAGETIPVEYTCNGDDTSPELNWSEPPEGTRSFVLIMDDPDAPGGTWVHWVIYDMAPTSRSIEANPATLNATAGSNSWGTQSYGGPCPPSGEHRYFFKLYALDTVLVGQPGLDKEAVLALMEGHILAQAELMGVYTQP